MRRLAVWWEWAAVRSAPRRIGFRDEPPNYGFEPYERSICLLKANLSPAQRSQFDQHFFFDIKGGDTGKSYRIRHGRVGNVEEHNSQGTCVRKWCFSPAGQLPIGDVMLAQKLALETFEYDALRVANRMW
jgi:hypothetical protein